jgi:hypothetical protein
MPVPTPLNRTLLSYLPQGAPIYAAPFGTLARLDKDCITIGCPPKGKPQCLVAYRVCRTPAECFALGLASLAALGIIFLRPS